MILSIKDFISKAKQKPTSLKLNDKFPEKKIVTAILFSQHFLNNIFTNFMFNTFSINNLIVRCTSTIHITNPSFSCRANENKSYNPIKEYIKPFKINIGGTVGYSSYHGCKFINLDKTPPFLLGILNGFRAVRAVFKRYFTSNRINPTTRFFVLMFIEPMCSSIKLTYMITRTKQYLPYILNEIFLLLFFLTYVNPFASQLIHFLSIFSSQTLYYNAFRDKYYDPIKKRIA
ncbi:hypothetical protein AGLY_009128 [Aphis glycines]|uniref:Uncharacterized protein n=1 Tax=Aphis glycines TaxID=307491 RepID=A0A6G0TKN5_APHGL|nr:hypothetical protein AGLY_009128 [Aphis glycines]